MTRVVILVEGESDRAAVLALAEVLGADLDANGVAVVAMGGITNIARCVEQLGPRGAQYRLVGLYDAAEERSVRRGVQRADLVAGSGPEGLAALGFHRCVQDLEDELIRALGIERVEAVLAANGDLVAFRTLQHQPAHRGGTPSGHLHRFFGAGSGRKIRYGRLLVQALTMWDMPAPLTAVLAEALIDPLAPPSTPQVKNS